MHDNKYIFIFYFILYQNEGVKTNLNKVSEVKTALIVEQNAIGNLGLFQMIVAQQQSINKFSDFTKDACESDQ